MDETQYATRLDKSLQGDEPYKDLLALAKRMRDDGVVQIAIYRFFEKRFVGTADDNPAYDAIADTLDEIWGGPWAKGGGLFETELSADRLNDQ